MWVNMSAQIVTHNEDEIKEGNIYMPKKIVKTTTRINEPVLENPPQKTYKTKKMIFRTYQVIWYILGVVEILLFFRFLLRFIGANPSSGFTNGIYTLSAPFALPFGGIVPATINGNSVFEWSTLIAMAVYAVIAWGIVELFQLIKPVNPNEVEQT